MVVSLAWSWFLFSPLWCEDWHLWSGTFVVAQRWTRELLHVSCISNSLKSQMNLGCTKVHWLWKWYIFKKCFYFAPWCLCPILPPLHNLSLSSSSFQVPHNSLPWFCPAFPKTLWGMLWYPAFAGMLTFKCYLFRGLSLPFSIFSDLSVDFFSLKSQHAVTVFTPPHTSMLPSYLDLFFLIALVIMCVIITYY